MSNIGFATLTVIPSMRGASDEVVKGLGGMDKAGKAAGQKLGQSVADGVASSRAAVEKASAQLAKARDKEADAAGKVRTEEAKLQALRDKGVTDVGRLTAAQERAAKASRDHAAVTKTVESATKDLAVAQEHAKKVADETGDSIESVGKKSIFTADNLVKFGAIATTGLAAAGAALYKVGETFDEVADTIRVGTGATGADLDALTDIAKKVGTEVPSSFEDIGQAVADLNTRLGLTGPDLEQVTAQVMELGNMGENVDINTLSQAMSAFGVESSKVSGTLDELFRVSQATGVPVGKLAETAVKGAPALKQFGFNAASSAGLIGSLDKAGLDADKMMAGLTKSLSSFAKAGEDPQKALYGTVVEIEKYAKAGNDAGAINMASKLFGTRGAAQFVDAVKAGTFSVDDFVSATGAGTDTIRGASEETRDFAEQWQLFKNQTLVALEPVATKVFGAIGSAMEKFNDVGVPALKSMFDWVARNKDTLQTFGVVAGIAALGLAALALQQKIVAAGGLLSFIKTAVTSTKVWTGVQAAFNLVMSANPISLVVIAIAALVAGFIYAYKKSETFRNIVQGAWEGIKSAVSAVWGWLSTTVWPGLKALFSGIGQTAIWLWQNVMLPAWNGIKSAIGALWGWISGTLWPGLQAVFRGAGAVVMWLWNNVMVPAWNGIKAAIGVAWGVIQTIFAGWKAAFNVVATVALWLWHNIITPVWDGIKAAISVAWDIIKAVFERLKQGFQNIADKAGEVKDWIIDRWNAVVNFFTGVKDKIASAASGMWDGIKDAFRGVINWIIRAWNSLQFTVPTIEAFGKKMGGFSIGVPKIQELATGGVVGRTKAGRFYGPGTGTSDSLVGVDGNGIPIVRVSAGEGVVRESAMESGGAAVVAALNSGWVPSPAFLAGMNGLQALAVGGVIGGVREEYGLQPGTDTGGYGSGGDAFPAWVHELGNQFSVAPSTYPGHQETDRGEAGYAPNPERLNRGIDWAGSVDAMQRFAEYAASVAGSSEGLEQIIWQNPGTGQKIGMGGHGNLNAGYYDDATYAQHQNHVHTRQSSTWPGDGAVADDAIPAPGTVVPGATPDSTDPATPPDTSSTGSTGSTGESTERKSFGSSISEIAGNFTKDLVGGQVSSLLGVLGINDSPAWLGAADQLNQNLKKRSGSTAVGATQAPSTTTDPTSTAPGTATVPGSDLDSAAPDTAGMVTNTPDGGIADGTPGAKAAVWAEWESAWRAGDEWLDTLRLVNGESAWDVNAKNPTSTAEGLFQFLDTTRAEYGYGPTAEEQAAAGEKYIANRYGSPSKAWAFWQAQSPHWYDAGGWLPQGVTLTRNETGGPEPILTREQWDDANAAIKIVQRMAEPARHNAPGVGYRDHIEYNIRTATVEDAFLTAQQTEKRRTAAVIAGR